MLYLCCTRNRTILDYPAALRVYVFYDTIGYNEDMVLNTSHNTLSMYQCILELTNEESTIATLLGGTLWLLPADATIPSYRRGATLFPNIPVAVHRAALTWVQDTFKSIT